MGKCFELPVLGTTVTNWDGGDTSAGVFISLLPEQEDELGPILERYGETCFLFEAQLNNSIKWEGRVPWAVVAFPEEYRLSGHACSVRQDQESMTFSSYSLQPGYSIERDGIPPISLAYPATKSALEYAASRSPLFAKAWELLRDKSEDGHWLCLPDPPLSDWLESASAGDDDLFRSLNVQMYNTQTLADENQGTIRSEENATDCVSTTIHPNCEYVSGSGWEDHNLVTGEVLLDFANTLYYHPFPDGVFCPGGLLDRFDGALDFMDRFLEHYGECTKSSCVAYHTALLIAYFGFIGEPDLRRLADALRARGHSAFLLRAASFIDREGQYICKPAIVFVEELRGPTVTAQSLGGARIETKRTQKLIARHVWATRIVIRGFTMGGEVIRVPGIPRQGDATLLPARRIGEILSEA